MRSKQSKPSKSRKHKKEKMKSSKHKKKEKKEKGKKDKKSKHKDGGGSSDSNCSDIPGYFGTHFIYLKPFELNMSLMVVVEYHTLLAFSLK